MLEWTVHPVLADALEAVAEEDRPPGPWHLGGPVPRLSIRSLVEVCACCVEAARPRVSAGARAEYDRLAKRVDRMLREPRTQLPAPGSLRGARTDAEHARGTVRIAALAAWAAAADGDGRAIAARAGRVAALTAEALARDRDAVQRFLLALDEQMATSEALDLAVRYDLRGGTPLKVLARAHDPLLVVELPDGSRSALRVVGHTRAWTPHP